VVPGQAKTAPVLPWFSTLLQFVLPFGYAPAAHVEFLELSACGVRDDETLIRCLPGGGVVADDQMIVSRAMHVQFEPIGAAGNAVAEGWHRVLGETPGIASVSGHTVLEELGHSLSPLSLLANVPC